MNAKEMFENLGYVQKMYTDEKDPNSNGIQYIKKGKDTEMQRIGMIITDYIEFYSSSKEIVIYTTYDHRNGNKTESDSGTLNFEEFAAVQQQVIELEW